MATATASFNLANDVIPAITSLGVANITHFKNHAVPFPHPVLFFEKLGLGCSSPLPVTRIQKKLKGSYLSTSP
jgi:hypothetical protein